MSNINNNLKKYLNDWSEIDDKIVELTNQAKSFKIKREELSNLITNDMKKNNILTLHHEGSIFKLKEENKPKQLKKDNVQDALKIHDIDNTKINNIMNTIMTNREIVTKRTLKRNKKN